MKKDKSMNTNNLNSKNNKRGNFRKLSIAMLIGAVLLMGCGKTTQKDVYDDANQAQVEEPVQGIAVGEPNPSAPDSTVTDVTLPVDEQSPAGTSPKIGEDAARAMQFDKQIEGIVSITLNDLEGNGVDRTFTADEIASIQQAFNDSYIMDTAYIEMIGGNTMTILLEDGRSVFIHSYGDENFIVARIGDGETYHLGCEVIGKILLEK